MLEHDNRPCVVNVLSTCCHCVVIVLSSCCYRLVIVLSSSCHRLVIVLSSSCRRVSIALSTSCLQPNFKRKMAATMASGGNMFDNVAYDKEDDDCCNGAPTATLNTVPGYDDVRGTTPPLTSTVIQVTA